MLPKDTHIFASFYPNEENSVLPLLEQVRAAVWRNIAIPLYICRYHFPNCTSFEHFISFYRLCQGETLYRLFRSTSKSSACLGIHTAKRNGTDIFE